MKIIIKYIFLFLILLITLMVVRTLLYESKQVAFDPVPEITLDEDFYKKYQEALTIKTISPEDPMDFDSLAFEQFLEFVTVNYPLVQERLEKNIFSNYSLLFKWPGSDTSLEPYVLMAHYDVVPVVTENLSDWKKSPFEGIIKNDTLWGRGALDDKYGVMAQLEAVERLIAEGYQPQRTLYLSFGHDEEIGGYNGAKLISEYLEKQEITLAFVLDEGGARSQGLIPSMTKEVALIGTAEKGFTTLELSVKIEGGHSSMPEKETAIDVLAHAVSQLKGHPMPAKISPVIKAFFRHTGPEMSFGPKLVFANFDIIKPLVLRMMGSSGSGNASIRTTTAPTIFNSGVKDNLIPQIATAKVNFRLLPGDEVSDVITHATDVIDDKRITIKPTGIVSEASKMTDPSGPAYQRMSKTIKQIFPGVITTPFLVVGGTDSRHFSNICDNIIRFRPYKLSPDNQKTFHGLNERMPLSEFKKGIQFYHQLILNCDLE